jgi:hypothetical protein
MNIRTDIFRETWSADGRYLIRAYAKVVADFARGSRAMGVVQVFDGDPSLTGKPDIFLSSSKLHGNDLLDELQNAERIGRDFIADFR